MGAAVELVRQWCEVRPIDGLRVEVLEVDGRTPVVLCEIPATEPGSAAATVLLYGHLDKQPEMAGWRAGLGPWDPALDGAVLYGRGAADDGYAVVAAFPAHDALRAAGGRTPSLQVRHPHREASRHPAHPPSH